MDIEVLTCMPNYSCDKRNILVIGTHNGIFHDDETVACAILCALNENFKIYIVRTRNEAILKQCDICVDIGGGIYDHNQLGFNLCRPLGSPYASAGLVWRDFGKALIEKCLKSNFPSYTDCTSQLWQSLDDEIFCFVDFEDSKGTKLYKSHCFNYISSFLPSWTDASPNYEEQFLKALKVTISIVQQQILHAYNSYTASLLVRDRWVHNNKYFCDNIMEIPSQTFPWVEPTVSINNTIAISGRCNTVINFVIFEYPDGGWAAQCVPPSLEEKNCQRIPFPEEWAGQTEQLPEISNVPDAIRCHSGRFFARAKTREGIIKMCKIATDTFLKQKQEVEK